LRDFAKEVAALPAETTKGPLTEKDLLRVWAHKISLGWLDEIEASIRSGALRGTEYMAARDKVRAEVERTERDYPWAARTVGLLGGAAGVTGVAAGLAATGILAPGVAGVTGIIPQTAANTIAGSMAGGGAVTGGVAGGIAGAGGLLGEEDTVMERVQRAAGGALAGAAAGSMTALTPLTPPGIVRTLLKYGLLGAGAGAGYRGSRGLF
jgi:hypothetical protein